MAKKSPIIEEIFIAIMPVCEVAHHYNDAIFLLFLVNMVRYLDIYNYEIFLKCPL